MKTITLLLVLFAVSAVAQTPEQIKEKRAREMHRVLNLDDRAAWEKFIKENYTQALIDRPMTAKVVGDDGPAKSEAKPSNNLEAKIAMMKQLHSDFAGSKLTSLKQEGEVLIMQLSAVDGEGKMRFKFEKQPPYRIDALGVEFDR
ncbi:MAG: hypothetical protein JST46_09125 [Bacteroidetes bacterium]|nr:hypothetical protein [Bacteroidota bacterium]